MLAREKTRAVSVGALAIGGGSPVAVQSMTNAKMSRTDSGPVLDADATCGQISCLAQAGCEIVRTAVPNMASLEAFEQVCRNSPIPVVADVHFDHRIAVGAALRGAAGVRINPGNIGSWKKVDEVIEACGQRGVAIRIGVNAGSLDQKWRERSDLPAHERMVASAVDFVEHFEGRGFKDIVVSAKAHSVPVCIQTYRRLSSEIPQVPLHLGVTEAGTLIPGTVKSSVGIGILLAEGIGDTFRVSLTDDVEKEAEVAWEILSALGLRRRRPELVSCPTCSRTEVDLIAIAQEVERRLKDIDAPLQVAVMGCVVNGPGEARDADVGVACGKDCGVIFMGGKPVGKVDAGRMVDALFDKISELV